MDKKAPDKAKSAPAFKEWLEKPADHIGAPVTGTLDMAVLKQLAEHTWFPESMPKRPVR